MELFVKCTPEGLIPLYDEDYDKKQFLVNGTVYKAKISVPRNLAFHRKYFSFINTAWEYLGEQYRNFFGNNKESFRKCVEVAAGHYEYVYSPVRQEWQQVPKSIAFDKMSEEDFEMLYDMVKDVVFHLYLSHINEEEFMKNLIRY